mmetsp:Transcript_3852/g.7662  ORF Transcript_3852/g.7662 Transcript_3852/m.7662 type:complete len:135 (+) Transcript_3852:147-551(+)
MASRRTTVVVQRAPQHLSPASRQLLIRVRQRQACRSALLLLGLLGVVLVSILSMTATTTRRQEYDAIAQKNVPVGRIRRLHGSSADDSNKNPLLIQEDGLRSASTNNQTSILKYSLISTSDVASLSNGTTTISK